jgi:formamidopyrimidine-DNA glycosylase
MPELPEVETIVRDLREQIPGATVARVSVQHPDILVADSVAKFQRALRGRKMSSVDRRAKNIVIALDDGSTLVIHLGMTGRVIVTDAPEQTGMRHIAARIDFADGRTLLYDDVRRFGQLEHFKPGHWARRALEFGVEPLSNDFTAARLFELTRLSISPIRNWLLDPYRVAGLGNIYANEALFRAGVRPTRRANTLTRAEATRLRETIRAVLQESIDRRGTTFSDYRDGRGQEGDFLPRLQVYDRAGEPCVRCGTPVKRIVLSNRSAFYCPKCQR